jgi:hypothetical protein
VLAFVVAHRSTTPPAPNASVPKLYYNPSAAYGIAMPYEGDGAWSFGALPLCLTAPGKATVTSIHPLGGNSQLKPLAFAVRPMPQNSVGAIRGPLTKLGFPVDAIVTRTCTSGAVDELGSTFIRTGPQDGTFSRLRIDYTSAGKDFSLFVPWGLKLCGPAKTTDEACGPVVPQA